MASEIKDANEVDLNAIKADLLYEWKKSYPIEHIVGWAKSLFIDGVLVAIGGVYVYHTGVGEAWLLLGTKAAQHKIEIVRVVRRMIDLAFKELKLWRIQASERRDFAQTVKMAEHLGFKLEGCMFKFTEDKADAFMYAIIKDSD